jgi:uncharacterized protein (TIGR03435 family)
MTALLLDHLWQSTIVALAAAAGAYAWRHHCASVRYALWLTASAKFLVPFAALSALGAWLPWHPRAIDVGRTLALTTIDAAGSPFSASLPQAAVPLTGTMTSAAHSTWPLLLALWACGAGVALASTWKNWQTIAAVARGATPVDEARDVRLLRQLTALEASSSGRPPVAIRMTSAAYEPGVFGLFAPLLLWPEQLTSQLSDAEIRGILEHEFAHVRRHDNLSAAFHAIVQTIFWFHPLVWWIGARLAAERERACDETVVAAGHAPEAYAESILKTCRFCVESPLPCAAGVTGGDLKQRVIRVVAAQPIAALGWRSKIALALIAVSVVAAPVALGALQTSGAPERIADPAAALSGPAFEVAAIKLNTSNEAGSRVMASPNGRLQAVNVTLKTLVRNAYRVRETQISGGPDWLDSARFDVEAKGPDQAMTTPDQVAAMMRQLIADRFRLEARIESREVPVYALVRARNNGTLGPQLKTANVDCAGLIARGVPPQLPAGGGVPSCSIRLGFGTVVARSASLSQLGNALSQTLGRNVIDRTGLTGLFDIDLTWTPDQLPPRAAGTPADQPLRVNGADVDPNGPSLFAALQEQLGLKLDSQRAPVDVLVITSATKPTVD